MTATTTATAAPNRHPRPRYPRYRNSGVKWLGHIPEHWEVRRLEHVASYRTSSVDKKTDDGELPVMLCNYTDVYYQDRIRASDGDFMEATASPHEVARFKLCVGDVLITKDSEDWQDIAVPALIEETADSFVCGYHLGIIRPGPLVESAFVFRAMQSVAVNQQLQTSASGVTRYGLPNAAVSDSLIPLPPLAEQCAIAGFLDRETERIDKLVGKKRLLIERLAEYRTALITRAVTRGLPPEATQAAGLDSSPRLKPSGVEWLGHIPEHWEVLRLRDCGHIRTGPFGSQLHADEYISGGVPIINPSNIVGGRLFPDGEDTISPEKAGELARHAFKVGDIAFGRRGEMARVALVWQSDLPAACGTGCLRIRSDRQRVEPLFLLHSLGLDALRSWLELVAVGSTLANLNEQIVGRVPLTLPPLHEQRVIVEWLSDSLERADALRRSVEIAIERLVEFRSALITAAVTGRIDVRDSLSLEETDAAGGSL